MVSKVWSLIRQRWSTLRRWQKILTVMGTLVMVAALIFYVWVFTDLPSIDNLQAGLMLPSTRILDRNGHLLYEIIPDKGGRNNIVQLADIPQSLVQATIATEDRNFYSTPGIDLEGMIRALWINVQGGE